VSATHSSVAAARGVAIVEANEAVAVVAAVVAAVAAAAAAAAAAVAAAAAAAAAATGASDCAGMQRQALFSANAWPEVRQDCVLAFVQPRIQQSMVLLRAVACFQ